MIFIIVIWVRYRVDTYGNSSIGWKVLKGTVKHMGPRSTIFSTQALYIGHKL